MVKYTRILLLFLFPVFMTAQSVVDIVIDSDEHNTLEEAVIAADLAGTLSEPGPFTLFAPTDAAFAALPAGTVAALLDDIPALRDILLYHALSGEVKSSDLSDGMLATTINGKDVTVILNTNGVFINNARVTMADIQASNGVVHVIDAVLLPPTNTVVDVIANSPDHNSLEAAVLAADLAETLSGEGPFTLFAPTDAAFEALPAGTVDALMADIPALTEILLYHAISGTVLSTDLSDGMMATTINGKDIEVNINVDGFFINDAKITFADIVTDNGVVHVIDAVLLPPRTTVVDVVVNSPDHSILEAAVLAADLDGTLSGDGPFTLFAPTDAAFAALPAGTVDALLADIPELTDILLYHAISGTVLSSDLSDGMMATTINGEDVTVTINTDGVFINSAQVTMADIITDNGVVHVIDAVLLPSGSSSVTDQNFADFRLYPNPATDHIQLEMDKINDVDNNVTLFNMKGELVNRWNNISNGSKIPIDQINAGSYFLRFENSSLTFVKKVLIH